MTTDLNILRQKVSDCTRCPGHMSCLGPVPGIGPSGAKILIIGHSPSNESDIANRPYEDRAGELFRSLIKYAGIPRRDLYVTYLVKCKGHKDETICKQWLWDELCAIRPRVIATLGADVTRTILKLKKTANPMKMAGHVILTPDTWPFRSCVVPLYSAEFLVINSGKKATASIGYLKTILDLANGNHQ